MTKYLVRISAPHLELVFHFPDHLRFNLIAFTGLDTKPVGQVDLASNSDYSRIVVDADIDLALTTNQSALPPSDTLLVTTEPSQMLREIELFVRGFNVPYSFVGLPVWNMPWTNFYLMCDRSIFDPLILLHRTIEQRGPAAAAEFARSLVYNTLSNVLFTRDRYEFYIQQQRMARRRQWDHQSFIFETAYSLNNFYLLAYSAL
ncbi:MAG: hypothetical protein WBW89_16970, partial [Candidatus Cybelea sp.]